MPSTTNTPLSVEGKRTEPIYVWAAIGICFLLLSIYVFGSWILSDEFRPVKPGNDPMPWYTEFFVMMFQFICWPITFGLIWWGIKTCKREGRVTVSMLFVFGWLTTYWQDPLGNYFRMYYTYNAHMFNMGSWVNFIPGWVMPNGHNFAEPVAFLLGAYTSIMPLQVFFCVWLMRKAKARWPAIGALGLVGVAFFAMAIADIIIEGGWVRAGLYAFTGTVHSWSIWGGQWYQFPLYEAIFWGAAMATPSCLLYFRNDKGETLVERGMDTITSPVRQTFLRMMAISAVFNIAYLVYNIIIGIINFQMDQTPDMPNYLSHGLCGVGTEYPCPGPTDHVPLQNSGPIWELDCSQVEAAGGRLLTNKCGTAIGE